MSDHCGTILLVEDDENDAILFRLAVKKSNINNPIAHTSDGEDAINYLKGSGVYSDRIQHPFPCLVITDLKMPKLTGFDVLTWIQKHEQMSNLPVIVLTSSSEDSDKKRAFELGSQAYWIKPPDLKELVALLSGLKNILFEPISQRT